jgi:hypothetical protein
MEQRRCAGCHKLFRPRPQCPEQGFCSAPACQRERKRRWQKAKRAADADYRDNDVQASRRWRDQHPGYWRAYRRKHPEYVTRNREQQRERDRAARSNQAPAAPTPNLANEDASALQFPLPTGTYRIVPARGGALANEDACLVEIAFVSVG